MESLPDDYPDPCHYYALDMPGGSMFLPGDSIDVDLTFQGRIIDVCNGDKIVESKEWTWKFQRTF